MGSPPLVAAEIGVSEGGLAEEGAAEAAPIAGDDAAAADAGIGEVEPASATPAVLRRDFPDVAIGRAFFHALAEAPHALVFALGGFAVFAGFESGFAGVEAEFEAGREFAFAGEKIFGDLVGLAAEASEEKPVWVGGGRYVVERASVRAGHVEGPLEHAEGIGGDDGVGLNDQEARGADFAGEGKGRALQGGDAELGFFFVAGRGVVFDRQIQHRDFPTFGEFALGDLGGGFGFLAFIGGQNEVGLLEMPRGGGDGADALRECVKVALGCGDGDGGHQHTSHSGSELWCCGLCI